MGGQSTPTTTTQIQKTELPAWVDNASQQNYQFAQDVANRPFQQYTGQRVAPLSQGEMQAPTTLQAGQDTASQLYGNAGGALSYYASGAANPSAVTVPQGVGNVAAQTLPQTNLSGYLNPYTDSVVNTTLADMQRQTNTAMQQNSDANRASGSWGGSRDAVSNAVLQSEGIRNQAATEAQLRSGAFTNAQSAAQTDNASMLQAALANQQSGLTTQAQRLQAQSTNASNQLAGAQLGISAGSALAGLGDSVTNSAGKNALLQSQLGANARSVQQAQDDASQQMFNEQYQAPLDALNTRLAALGMSPYGKTTTGTSTTSGGTSSNTGLSVLGGAMSFLPLMFGSDERLKKNVKTIGRTESGAPLKSFEYKGFMGRAAPGKQVGVMAQDMEKVRPDAVHRFQGPDGKFYRAVDYSKVGRGFMGRGKAA